MNDKANIQHNKLMKLDDTMLMYCIYNAEMLEKLCYVWQCWVCGYILGLSRGTV